jgi:cyclophilin family peptidyl-prolyl cis-trans isomerase
MADAQKPADPQKPTIPGQITAPNPFELFWEKNRKMATSVLVATAAVISGFYGYRAFHRRQVDQEWASFSQATELGKNHSEGDASFEQWRSDQQFARFWRDMSQKALIDGLPKRMGDLKPDELRAELARAKGAEREPYLLWVLANTLRIQADYAGAKEAAERLTREFPKHHLCVAVAWPPTYVPVESPDDDSTPATARKPKKSKLPEKPPENASAVALLLQGIDRDQAFRQNHRALFEAPQPDPTPIVTLKLKHGDREGIIKIGLFSKQAPKLSENFLKKAKEGFFKDQNVHLLRRAAANAPGGDTASYFALGNPQSKDPDRQKWTETPPKDTLPMDESPLSPFAGMLTAPVTTGVDGRKVNGEVFHILGSDASLDHEENKSVVFGRVIEGMDVVDGICKEAFLTAAESAQGRGVPQKAIQVLSVDVTQ